MAKYKWNEVTAADVITAISIFDSENPEYPEPRSTFLVYNGKKYPAKHIRGMAYQVHFGIAISKNDYAGGQETVRFFDRLNFETQYTNINVDTHPVKSVNHKMTNKAKHKLDNNTKLIPAKKIEDKSASIERITIPAKGVIEQKNALQLLLNCLCGGDIVCEKTFPWMKTPSELDDTYVAIYNALSAYRGNKNFAKKNISLRCDFVCEGKKLIIEYDERQHFSEARRLSLLYYPDVCLYFDKNLWIDACSAIQARDNQPQDRDEIRAYYDSTRDIEAARNGYKLVRIMHGQIDFEENGAYEKLKNFLGFDGGERQLQSPSSTSHENNVVKSVKIGLYLQTDELHGDRQAFDKAMQLVCKSDIDILVFPEFSYVPFCDEYDQFDFLNDDDMQEIRGRLLDWSKNIGRAVVVCIYDLYDRIMSIYVNAFAQGEETKYKEYIKHTMTNSSACDIENYSQYADKAFRPIVYKGHRIGLTICYDCNHAMFSKKYGLNGVDIILNSTGGNVVNDKWYKYNKVRAIENHCFNFVTMGGQVESENPHNYVYGFTPEGKAMHPVMINGEDNGRHNISGGIYVYDTAEYDGTPEVDPSINQIESINKNIDIFVPAKGIDSFIQSGKRLTESIYIVKIKDMNVVICIVKGEDISKPEKVLKLLYAKELKSISNKRYIVFNLWDKVDLGYYRTKLSEILKVRAMENFCAVVMASENITKCFQCGRNRTAQVVKQENGRFGIDLSRTGGPETIWKNKEGMRASWRDNIEWLIDSMQ